MAKKKLDWRVEQRDCVKAMEAMRATMTTGIRLICGDAPYNIGKKYEAYDDNRPFSEYMDWTREWLAAADGVLHQQGTLVVFYPDELVADVDVHIRHNLGLHRRSWIIWAFGFGVACQNNFSRGHVHIMVYTKSKTKFTFNADAIRVPSDRQLVYGDKRALGKGKVPNNVWLLTREQMFEELPLDADVWYMSRICGTFKERQKHSPNQIPVPLMERLVRALSNPGDYVLDPFVGTGSTGVAAVLRKRNFIGYDISKTCVAQSKRRIAAALGK